MNRYSDSGRPGSNVNYAVETTAQPDEILKKKEIIEILERRIAINIDIFPQQLKTLARGYRKPRMVWMGEGVGLAAR